MELEDDIPVGDALAVADVADPVVRQVRTDQDEVSGREAADVGFPTMDRPVPCWIRWISNSGW
jgi:hypothetical protein